jgi:hypothetical protein
VLPLRIPAPNGHPQSSADHPKCRKERKYEKEI